MNNSGTRQQRSLLDEQRGRTDLGYTNFLDSFRGRVEPTLNESQSLRNQIRDKYTNSNNFMSVSPNSTGWFDLPGMGGAGASAAFDPNGDFDSARTGYQKFADTGGRENFADAENAFKGFVNNGGLGEGEASAIRTRAYDSAQGLYNSLKNKAIQRRSLQGGYSPGFDSGMAELAREGGRAGASALRSQEGDIIDKRMQGREFGASGLAGIGGQVSGNQLAGLGGLTNIGQAGQQNAQFNAGLSDAREGRNLNAQLALQGLFSQGGRESAQGLQSLYSSAPGDVGQLLQYYLGGLGGMSGANLANLGQRGQQQDRSWMDLIPGLIGSAGGIAGAFAGVPPGLSRRSLAGLGSSF